ncbi:MAG: MBL fold metallo-hydrolase [Halalkalicoccus sp.]
MSYQYENLTIDRLGHASIRFVIDDTTVVYIDPWSEVIENEPVTADYVFITHDDFDHYDPEGIAQVMDDETTVIVYKSIDTADLDIAVQGIADEELTFDAFTVEPTPAYNHPDGPHIDEDGNPYHSEGEVIGLRFNVGDVSVWYPSDTDHLAEHEMYEVNILIPPIGGTYTMDQHEAAALAVALDPDVVLPIHYNTFEAVKADAESLVAELAEERIEAEPM